MQKTKLGISVGFLSAIAAVAALLGGSVGFFVGIVIMGYVLLFEENEWLRKSVVKIFAIMVVFILADSIVGFIPDIIGVISSFFGIFGGGFSLPLLPGLVSFVRNALAVVEKFLIVVMALKSLTQGLFNVPIVDSIVEKHYEGKAAENGSDSNVSLTKD